jgi:hypothetical protein
MLEVLSIERTVGPRKFPFRRIPSNLSPAPRPSRSHFALNRKRRKKAKVLKRGEEKERRRRRNWVSQLLRVEEE